MRPSPPALETTDQPAAGVRDPTDWGLAPGQGSEPQPSIGFPGPEQEALIGKGTGAAEGGFGHEAADADGVGRGYDEGRLVQDGQTEGYAQEYGQEEFEGGAAEGYEGEQAAYDALAAGFAEGYEGEQAAYDAQAAGFAEGFEPGQGGEYAGEYAGEDGNGGEYGEEVPGETDADAWGAGLSDQQWAEIAEASVLERKVAGWEIWSFSMDGVTMQKYYQHATSGQSQWERPVEVARSLAKEVRQNKLNEYGFEGLDDDDDPRPWAPPTLARAFRTRIRRVFGGGRAPLWATKEADFAAMGVGVSLYFRLLRTLASFFLIASLLYVPALVIFASGSRIPNSFLDPLSSARLSLGNIGSRDLAAAETSAVVGSTPNFATFFGLPMTGFDASYVVSFLDLAVLLVFVFLVSFFARRIDAEVDEAEKRVVRARDFTIFVRGVPGDATEAELRDFFSERFSLDDLDAQFRILDGQEMDEAQLEAAEEARKGLFNRIQATLARSKAAKERLGKRVRAAAMVRTAAAGFMAVGGQVAPESETSPLIEGGGLRPVAAGDSAAVGLDAKAASGAAAAAKPGLSMIGAMEMVPPSMLQGDEEADAVDFTVKPGAGASAGKGTGTGKGLAVVHPSPGSPLTPGSGAAYKLPEFAAEERKRQREANRRSRKAGQASPTKHTRARTEVSIVGLKRVIPQREVRTHQHSQSDEQAIRDRLALYAGASVVDFETPTPEEDGESSGGGRSSLEAPNSSPDRRSGGRTTKAGGRRFDFAELQGLGRSQAAAADGIMSAAAAVKLLTVHHPSDSFFSADGGGEVSAASAKAGSGPKKGSSRKPKIPEEIRVVGVTAFGTARPHDAPGLKLGVHPVLDVTHNSKIDSLGSWVADVAMVEGDGASLRAFKAAEKLTLRLQEARARMKMARGDTPLKKGPDEKAYAKASEVVDRLGSRIAILRERVGAATKLGGAASNARSMAGQSIGGSALGAVVSLMEAATGEGNEDGEARGAFVTFNHEESFLRAMAAYRGSHRWFFRCCQPVALRFRGKHRLIVKQAPDPSDLLWEYIGTSNASRSCRRCCTNFAALLLLLGAFVLVLVAQAAKERLSAQIPDLADCDTTLPSTFFGGLANATAAAAAAGGSDAAVALGTSSAVVLDRPAGDGSTTLIQQGVMDQSCGTGSFFVGYLSPTLEPFVTGGYATGSVSVASRCGAATTSTNLPAGTVIGHPACPNPDSLAAQCPCAPSSSAARCPNLPCFRPELRSEEVRCETWPVTTIAGCFCLTAFQRLIASDGAIDGTARFVREHQDLCGDFASTYTQTQALTIVASLSAAVVNIALAKLMKLLVDFERHVSVSERSAALVSKTTVAQIFNTAAVMLLVQMRLPNNAAANVPVVRDLGILQGSLDSMTWQWYVSVGFGIFTTLAVTVVLSVASPIIGLAFNALARMRIGTSAAIAAHGSVPTQQTLDHVYVDRAPRLDERYPPLLALTFVTVVYSAGIPLLAPVAAAALWATYAIDKYLLLRRQRKPPAYSGALARYAAGLLPYAVVAHCVMAVLMLGQPEVLPSHNLPTVRSFLSESDSSGTLVTALTAAQRLDLIGALPRITRWNTCFFAALGAGLLAFLLVRGIIWSTVLNTIASCGLSDICACGCCNEKVQGLPPRKWAAPFTGFYGRALDERADLHRQRTWREVLPGWLACLLCLCCCGRGDVETREAESKRFQRVRLTAVERSQGWRIERVGKVPVLRKVLHSETGTGGTPAAPAPAPSSHDDRLKMTWEVISDLSGLATYALESNPDYAQAVLASGAVKTRAQRAPAAPPGPSPAVADHTEDEDVDEDDEDADEVEDEETLMSSAPRAARRG